MFKTVDKPEDEIIVSGDFNLEPWDESLSFKGYIESYFFKKLFDYYSVRSTNRRIYYNPILEYIQAHGNINLIGTFYKGNYKSTLDSVLLTKGITNFELDLLTEISHQDILIEDGEKHSLVDGFDHLPLLLKII
jgi:hypothetical protein